MSAKTVPSEIKPDNTQPSAGSSASNKPPAEPGSIEAQPISKVSINKYDPYQLKSSIDDEIIQLLEKKSFQEYNTPTDLKILVGLVACVLGAVSHFYPIPFPKNKPLLVFCIIGYLICASLYYFIESKLENDAFYISRDHKLNSLKDFTRVRFCSTIEMHDDKYQFKIESTNKKEVKIEYEQKYSVTQFYDDKGYLHRYKVRDMLDEHLNKFISARK